MSPAGTLCFDIFSPPSGDSDVISHVDLLSSNETNIATRSLRIALGASGRSATVCMVVSRVGGRNLTLLERRSLSTSPWDLEAPLRRDRLINAFVIFAENKFYRQAALGIAAFNETLRVLAHPFV